MTRRITLLLLLPLMATATIAQEDNYLRNPLPNEWNGGNLFEEESMPDDHWWQNFDDAQLDSLISEAMGSNLSVLSAIENMRKAKAVWRQAQSSLYPQLNMSIGWQRAHSSGNTAETQYREVTDGYYSGGASLSWQIDLFGSIYMRAKAQKRLFMATEEEYKGVMLSLCASIAITYFSIKESSARLQVLHSNVESQKEIIAIVTSRYNSGLASKLDVAQSKSVYYSTLAQIPAMEANIENYRNSLAVLLGLYPEDIRNKEIGSTLPSYVELIATGVPATLLRRRPDIRAAERNVEAAAAALGATRRDWFPQFFLNGSFGYSSQELKELPRSRSMTWEIAPTMTWTIFNGGKRVNATREARAALEQNILSFNSSILTAVQEVENAMSNYRNSVAQIVATREAVNQSNETLRLSLELYKQGLVQFQNVLDAQRTVLSYEDYLVQAQGTSLKSLVQLYESLGGGW